MLVETREERARAGIDDVAVAMVEAESSPPLHEGEEGETDGSGEEAGGSGEAEKTVALSQDSEEPGVSGASSVATEAAPPPVIPSHPGATVPSSKLLWERGTNILAPN